MVEGYLAAGSEAKLGSNEKPHVVVVSHSYNEQGRIKPFAELSTSVKLTLIKPRGPGESKFALGNELPSESQFTVIALPIFNLGGSRFIFRGLRKVLRGIQADTVLVEYDLWHLQFLQVLLSFELARSRVPLIAVVKKNTFRAPTSAFGRGKRLLCRLSMRRVNTIIAASHMAQKMYIEKVGVDASKVVVQPHLSVDTTRFRPLDGSSTRLPLRLGFVGRIDATKGVPELLAAVRNLRRLTKTPFELWLAGEITDHALASQVLQADGIHYFGSIKNESLHHFMNEIDLFVMPSRILPDHQEHDGRAVLEAMASGLPCVVSDSGILPEIVTAAEGRVFRAGDAAALASCIKELVESHDLRVKLGLGAREKAVSTVSPEALSSERLTVLRKLVVKNRG